MAKMLELEVCVACPSYHIGYCDDMHQFVFAGADHGIDPACPLPDAPRWVAMNSGELPALGVDVPVLLGGGRLRNLAIAKCNESTLYAGRILWWAGLLNVTKKVTHWLRGMPALPEEGVSDGEGTED